MKLYLTCSPDDVHGNLRRLAQMCKPDDVVLRLAHTVRARFECASAGFDVWVVLSPPAPGDEHADGARAVAKLTTLARNLSAELGAQWSTVDPSLVRDAPPRDATARDDLRTYQVEFVENP